MKTNDLATPLEISLTRLFDAPRSLVFEVWTRPEHLAHWSAPHGFTIPEAEGELKPGGKWHCLMIAPDGTRHPLGGIYQEVVADELLVMTHCWEDDDGNPEHETLVTVRFADEGDKTRVTLEQKNFQSIESRDGHLGGWTQCLDRLNELLESKPPVVIERVFDATVSVVWKAISDNSCFKHWYFELPEFRAEVGCEFEFEGGEEGKKFLHHCRVASVVPEKELAYTWRYAGHEGDSLVTFALFPEGAKTRLRLTHTGLESFPPIKDFARGNFLMGWTEIIGTSLKKFVETR